MERYFLTNVIFDIKKKIYATSGKSNLERRERQPVQKAHVNGGFFGFWGCHGASVFLAAAHSQTQVIAWTKVCVIKK